MAEDTDLGVEHAEAALALIDAREDPLLYSFALHNAARYKLFAGLGADHDAVDLGMQLQREGAAWEVSVLPAYWALYFDDFDTARTRFEELVRVFRERGNEAHCSVLLAHLAVVEALTGHPDRARALAGEALDLAMQTEQETWIRVALWARGQVAARTGDLTPAGRRRSSCSNAWRLSPISPSRTWLEQCSDWQRFQPATIAKPTVS